MAQTGYTPILLYASGTATNVPLAANMTSSASGAELALNYADGKLFYKDSSGVVQVLATKGAGTIGGSNTQVQYNNSGTLAGSANLTFDGTTLTANALTTTSTVTINGGTANGVAYLNGSKVLTTGSALVFDGTNFGLGVTPSAWGSGFKAIQVGKSGSFYATTATNSVSVSSNFYNNGTNNIYISTDLAALYQQYSGQHVWYNAPSGTAGNAITFTQAMTLDANGNLGVGTTSPASKFNVADTSTNCTITVTNSASNFQVQSNSNDAYFNLNGSGNIIFRSGTSSFTEKARIDSSGNLLVGTTSAVDNSGTGLKLLYPTLGYPEFAVVGSASTSSNTAYTLYSTGFGAYRFYVDYGGTIHATSITITAISDERLKENVKDIETGLDAVMALKPRRFDWKEGKGQDKKNVAGFIAQEFETVFPECVGTTKAGGDGIEYKNINHETLIPTLVKAIQELSAQVTTLQTQVTALKG